MKKATELRVISKAEKNRKCILCGSNTVNKLQLGELYFKDGLTAHHFCLLFSSNLKQNGADDEGIEGFLVNDIRSEYKRVRKDKKLTRFYKCRFCNKPGATIRCNRPECPVVFHFPCGLENGVNYQFGEAFIGYCSRHAGRQKSFRDRKICKICFGSRVRATKMNYMVFGSCCDLNANHKECLQEYALSAGYHFKCPSCANKTEFKNDVEKQGIYVPARDASWERETNAYRELNRKYTRCDAPNCARRNFRDNDPDSGYFLIRCHTCAASATHIKCWTAEKLLPSSKWSCVTCRKVEEVLSRNQNASEFYTDDNESLVSSLFTAILVRKPAQPPEPPRMPIASKSRDTESSTLVPTHLEGPSSLPPPPACPARQSPRIIRIHVIHRDTPSPSETSSLSSPSPPKRLQTVKVMLKDFRKNPVGIPKIKQKQKARKAPPKPKPKPVPPQQLRRSQRISAKPVCYIDQF